MSAGREAFDRAALVDHARQVIARGSRSFAAASRLFDRETRERVWLLYAWCRECDDIADAQDLGGALGDQSGAAERLATIRALTALALAGEPTGRPSFDCFAVVARECGISADMAEDVIAGFALDADGWQPRGEADLLRYCYHVAGAVGVMMAAVMGVAADDEDTLARACDLGLAFQLGNVARDLAEDDRAGRCYVPAEWLAEADIPPGEQLKPPYRKALAAIALRMAGLAAVYEASARIGAARLAFRQRWAVLAAAGIYGAIAREVAARGPHAWDRRVTTSGWAKLGHVARGFVAALRGPGAEAARPRWSRRELALRARGGVAFRAG
ncbi:phytoene/squalene synthase family protein [Novosphingobium bradum]|uniref:Phytoene/squalene synthase family protein n=1 Tax=Novosphingobium bradum TaxID=1737444 RepID=A0ABV7ITL9_9SPHN